MLIQEKRETMAVIGAFRCHAKLRVQLYSLWALQREAAKANFCAGMYLLR